MLGRPVEMTEVERVLALKSLSGFADLAPDDLSSVARRGKVSSFEPGETVLRDASRSRDLYFVVEGCVALRSDQRVIARFGPGELVGGYARMSRDAVGVHAIAERASHTLRLRRSDLEDLVEDNFSLLLSVMSALARDVVDTRCALAPGAGYSEPGGADPSPPRDSLGLVDRIVLLETTPSFGPARVQFLAELAQCAREAHYQEAATLWSEGTDATHILVVASGIVVCNGTGGACFRRGAGDVLGIPESVASQKRWYQAAAETPVHGLLIGAREWVDLLEDDIDMALEGLRGLSDTSLWLHEQLAQLDVASPAGGGHAGTGPRRPGGRL